MSKSARSAAANAAWNSWRRVRARVSWLVGEDCDGILKTRPLAVGSKMIRLRCLYGQETTQNTTNNILKCEVWVNPSLQSSQEWWRVTMVRNDAISWVEIRTQTQTRSNIKCDGRITRDAARYNRLLCRIYWDTKLGGETSMLYWVYEGNIYLQ